MLDLLFIYRFIFHVRKAVSQSEQSRTQVGAWTTMADDKVSIIMQVILGARNFTCSCMEDPLRSWETQSLSKVCSTNPPLHPRSRSEGSPTIWWTTISWSSIVLGKRTGISDYTSRHPMPLSEWSKFELRTTTEVRRYVNYVVTCSTPKAVARNQVKDATDEDPALQALKKCINQGWIDTNDARAQQYRQVFHELTIVEGIVLRGDRIVVPAKLSVDFCGPMASGDIALIFYPQYAR